MKHLFPYQWTTAIIGIVIAFIILLLIRRDLLHVKRSLWWIGIAALIVVMGFFPTTIDKFGILLGVNYPPVLILTLGIGFILIKILSMDLERSRQERTLRRLTQRMAILEGMLSEVNGKKEER
ncbi:MAG: DUF2304 domain-containing protein [Proteobacteria bacterium]|jgi:hypothetical protein|nr:DUF2304 domain-containing protein [Pseudomonadota bacterium]